MQLRPDCAYKTDKEMRRMEKERTILCKKIAKYASEREREVKESQFHYSKGIQRSIFHYEESISLEI